MINKLLSLQCLVSVALERLVAIYVPTQAKVWFSKKRAAIGLVILAVTIVVIDLSRLINMKLYTNEADGKVIYLLDPILTCTVEVEIITGRKYSAFTIWP